MTIEQIRLMVPLLQRGNHHQIIKRIDTGSKEGLLLVAQANKGQLEAWTFMPDNNPNYQQKHSARVC